MQLPNEIIQKIIQILLSSHAESLKEMLWRQDLCLTWMQVSKSWRAALGPLYREHFDMTLYSPRQQLQLLERLLRWDISSSKELKLLKTNPEWSSQNSCMEILASCRHLQRLTLVGLDLTTNLPQTLEALELVDCIFDPNIFSKLPRLLSFSTNATLQIHEIKALLLANPAISALGLQGISVLSYLDNHSTLTSLDLSNSEIDISELEKLPQLSPFLKSLSLFNLPIYGRQARRLANMLAALPFLTTLDLRATSAGIHALNLLQPNQIIKNLTELKIGTVGFIGEHTFRILFSMTHSLKRLEFHKQACITPQIISAILRRLGFLESLILPCNQFSPMHTLVTPQELLRITTSLTHLSYLIMNGYEITPEIISTIALYSKKLRFLDLSSCRNKGVALQHVLSLLEINPFIYIRIQNFYLGLKSKASKHHRIVYQ
jgi:hypothetical protein